MWTFCLLFSVNSKNWWTAEDKQVQLIVETADKHTYTLHKTHSLFVNKNGYNIKVGGTLWQIQHRRNLYIINRYAG